MEKRRLRELILIEMDWGQGVGNDCERKKKREKIKLEQKREKEWERKKLGVRNLGREQGGGRDRNIQQLFGIDCMYYLL